MHAAFGRPKLRRAVVRARGAAHRNHYEKKTHHALGEAALRTNSGKTRLALGATVVALVASAGACAADPGGGNASASPGQAHVLVTGQPGALDNVRQAVAAAGGRITATLPI